MTDKPLLSREEILGCNDIGSGSLYFNRAMESMSEYAENTAIDFDMWKFGKGWMGVWIDGKFCYRLKHEFKSPQDLYKLYTNSKTETP